MTNEELLEEARRRYPKGTEYYCAHLADKHKCKVSNPDNFYEGSHAIYESDGNIEKNGHAFVECIYDKGKWAEIVSTPTVESKDPNVFPAGSYVVLLAGCTGEDTWGKDGIPVNHCYKLTTDSNSNSFYPDTDANESTTNGWSSVNYNSKLKLRAATQEEIAEYKRLSRPFDVTLLKKKSFQIGRWYKNKNVPKLFIKPNSIDGKYITSNVIWSTGRYQEEYTADDIVTDWNLLNDLSIIQEFLPDGHPDKVVVEKTPLEICKEKYKAGMEIMSVVGSRALLTKKDVSEIYVNSIGYVYTSGGSYQLYNKDVDKYAKILKETEQKSLVGRYLKALVDNPSCAGCYKKGDYIKIKIDNGSGSVICTKSLHFGNSSYDWKKSEVELMREGFHPDDVEPPVPAEPLEEKYAKELAEVERLFPEGTEGTYKCSYDGRTETCKRNGPLALNEHEGIIRIVSRSRGLLWSTEHGYSTPNITTTPKLKVGQWVKIIDKPKVGRPDHWCPDGEMDKYFGQWVQIESLGGPLEGYNFSVKDTEDDWYFKHSDYTEVRDDIINLDAVIKSDNTMPLYSMTDFKETVERSKYPTLKRKRKQKLVNTIVNIPTVVERIKRNK